MKTLRKGSNGLDVAILQGLEKFVDTMAGERYTAFFISSMMLGLFKLGLRYMYALLLDT